MKMKNLLTTIAFTLMAFVTLSANNAAPVTYITKDYNLKDFTGINASGIVEVQVVKSNTWKVTVTMPDVLEDYMVVRVSNGQLNLNMLTVPIKITRNLKNWNVTAKVEMPVLSRLDMSGATKFKCNDTFDIGDEIFKMDISGAAKVESLDVIARRLNMEMSGATVANFAGDFDDADIEMGGAAKGTFNINAIRLHQEIAGAVKTQHNGDFDKINLEASGAAAITFNGKAAYMLTEASGAAKVVAKAFPIDDVKMVISGASYCEINAGSYLEVDASGGSSLKYVAHDGLNLKINSNGRGSSVTKMN